MRILAVLVGVGLAAAAALVVARLWLWPGAALETRTPGAIPAANRPVEESDRPLPPPLTASEREAEVYAERRRPLRARLQAILEGSGAHAEVASELDTLVIVFRRDVGPDIPALQKALTDLRIGDYGFRRVRILREPQPGSGAPPSLLAELSSKDGEKWVTFLR